MPWRRLIRPGTLNLSARARTRVGCVLSRSPHHQLRYDSTSTTRPHRHCRDVASLLDSSQNEDPSPRRVELIAHVRSIRAQKKRAFVSLGDGSTTRPLQALLEPAQATGLNTGTAVKISGLWQPSPPSKEQTHELVAETIEVVGPTDPQIYPVQKKFQTPEFLRTIPHLRLRTSSNGLLARLRSDFEYHASIFFRKGGFVRLHPPAITSSDCEGAGEVFVIRPRDKQPPIGAAADEQPVSTAAASSEEEFFRSPKYLAVSSQLHLEAFVHEHQRVWALAPTFRAERSDTPRHLSEFYMLEAELRCQTLDEVMDVVENLVRHVASHIQSSRLGMELLMGNQHSANGADSRLPQLLKDRLRGLQRLYWPRISYTQAIQLLKEAAKEDATLFKFPPNWTTGLQLEHEKYIAATVGNGSPVFVTDYPKHVKPFYMLPSHMPTASSTTITPRTDTTSEAHPWKSHSLPPRPSVQEHMQQAHPTVACFDLLLPDIGELVGGSLREHRFDALEASMREHNLSSLDWYLDLRRYGSVPHGGFGLGFDRLLMYLSGVESIRDVVQWPRYHGRCDA